MEFHERLKDLRLSEGKTLTIVAKDLGVTVSAYSNYEQGFRTPSIEIIKRICRYFNVSADYLFGLNEYK